MEVREIRPIDKRRQKICLEDETLFPLYNSEVRRFGIEEGADISEEKLEEIVKLLVRRAQERCFHLLKDSDKTEFQIRRKLREGFYPPSVVDTVIGALKEYHYVDDLRYAERYAEQMQERQSGRETTQKLSERGIPREIISEALEEFPPLEDNAVAALMAKRLSGKDASDPVVREKTFAYLYRKGYSLSEIDRAYRHYCLT